MDPNELKWLRRAAREMMKSCSSIGLTPSQPTQSLLREQVLGKCALDLSTLSSFESSRVAKDLAQALLVLVDSQKLREVDPKLYRQVLSVIRPCMMSDALGSLILGFP